MKDALIERTEALNATKTAKRFTLATADKAVTFEVSEQTVTVTRTSTPATWTASFGPYRETVTLDAGRAEYARLLACGFRPW